MKWFTESSFVDPKECTSDRQDTMDDQHTTTDNDVQDNINQWVLSITDDGTEKNKKKHKRKQCDVVEITDVAAELDGCKNTESAVACTDVPLKAGKKKSKSKEKDVDQMVVEDNEMIVVEQKKKRKSKMIIEDAPVEKKSKLQANDETEKSLVKKHKKKKAH